MEELANQVRQELKDFWAVMPDDIDAMMQLWFNRAVASCVDVGSEKASGIAQIMIFFQFPELE